MTDIERKIAHFEKAASRCRKHKAKPTVGFDGTHFIECGQGCSMHDGENVEVEPIMTRWEDEHGR